MSNCLNMFKKLGFSKKMKPATVRERSSTEPTLPTQMSAMARPSSVSTTDESDSVSGDSLEGTVDLIVHLPDKRAVTASVEKRMPMMDLLVHVATANKFSPGNYVLKIVNDLDNTFVTYKPSTPIGSLNTSVIYVEPKKTSSEISSKTSKGLNSQPFEKTFRLQVHLPKQQLLVLRVSPQIKLHDLHKKICDNKGLDPHRYKLQHPQNEDLVMDLALTLENYNLTEINMIGSTISVIRENSLSNNSSSAAYKDNEKSKRTTFSFLRQKSKPCVVDNDGVDSNSRDASAACAEASLQTTAVSNGPNNPAVKVVKKRPAPPPPPAHNKTQTRSERPPPPPPLRSKSTSSVKSSHSRHSSDSSGYHDSSVLGDSPELIEPEAKLDSNSRNVSTSNTSLAMAGVKKRRAPLPPGQRLFSKPSSEEEKTTESGSNVCNDNRTFQTEPSCQSPSPLVLSSKRKDGSASDPPPAQSNGLKNQSPNVCDQNHNTLEVASHHTHKKLLPSDSDVSASSDSLTNSNESESKTSSSSTIKELEGSQEHLSEVGTQQVHALNGSLQPSPNLANTNDSSHASHLPSESQQVPLEHDPSRSPSSTLGTTHNQNACGSVASDADLCACTGDNVKDVEQKNNNNKSDTSSCSSLEVTEAEVHSNAEDTFPNCIQEALSDIDHVISDAEADVISFSSHSSTVVMDVDDKVDEDDQPKVDVCKEDDIVPKDQVDRESRRSSVVVEDVQDSVNCNKDVAAVVETEDVKSTPKISCNPIKQSRVSESSVEDDDDGLTFEEPDKLEPMVVRPGNRKPLLNFSIATYKSRVTSNGLKIAKVESFNEDLKKVEKQEVKKVVPTRASSFHEHENLSATTTESPSARPTRNVILTVNPALAKASNKNEADDDANSVISENSVDDSHLTQEHTKSMSMTNLEAINEDGKLRKSQSEFFLNEGNGGGEDYFQLQHEYLKLQKKLFYWQQQLLNNQTLLQRQRILPSNAFQLSAEMLSVPPDFDSGEDSTSDLMTSKASTFPKQNVKRNKDEIQPIFAKNKVPNIDAWHEVPDEVTESSRRDYQNNWKTSSTETKPRQEQDIEYFCFGKKNEQVSNGETAVQNGTKSSFQTSTEKRTSVPTQPTIQFVERSAKDIKRNSTSSSEFPNKKESTHISSSQIITHEKLTNASSSDKPQIRQKESSSRQGLSFKDIPLRFSLSGYNDVNRSNSSANDPVPNERKFRRQRVAPKELDEPSDNKRGVKPSFLFGEKLPEIKTANDKNRNGFEMSTVNGSERTVKKPSVARTQESAECVGTSAKSVNRNISVVKIESNTEQKDMLSQPRIIKSKPKFIPPPRLAEVNQRDVLLQAIKNFGGKQKLRKVADSELS